MHELARALRRPAADLDARLPFRQLGLDSLMAVRIVLRLETALGLELHPTLLFEHPTADAVVRYLQERLAARSA
jgi:acyl carrier protein